MDKKVEKELLEFLDERRKRKIFFQFLQRKIVYLPTITVVLFLMDDPHMNLVALAVKLIKKSIGM